MKDKRPPRKITPLTPSMGPSADPDDVVCPKCGWSLLNSGMSQDAHDSSCDGLLDRSQPITFEDVLTITI